MATFVSSISPSLSSIMHGNSLFFFSRSRRHTICYRDWSSDVCSSDLARSTVANVAYALGAAGVPSARHAAAIAELLALVGLGHAAERPARRLSAGEQHRLALARALARDPAVLFLDEPTASLDPASTKAMEDVIRAVSTRGVKVVMATHDLGEARRLAGDIVFLHRGRIVETSDALAFFASPQPA